MKYLTIVFLLSISTLSTTSPFGSLGYDCFHGTIESPYDEIQATVQNPAACPEYNTHLTPSQATKVAGVYYPISAGGVIDFENPYHTKKHFAGDPRCRYSTQNNNI